MYVLRSKLLGSIVLMPCLGEATIEKADFPLRIGYEASGVVIEVGEEVNHLRLGEEVCIVPQIPSLFIGFKIVFNFLGA